MPEQQIDRLFFLTAKTPGRQLALDALQSLRKHSETPLSLRVLEHTARDKACEHPDKACHGESCPLAQGFYDRLPAARAEAVAEQWLDQASVRRIALKHSVCPYYLSQELCRWSDLVVGDYNYYFDMSALLYGLTVLNDWRVTVLVDEAHNLIDRARGMYTAELDQDIFNTLRKQAPAALKAPLDRVARHWNALHRDQTEDYQIYPAIADLFILSLQKAVSAITEHLTDQPDGNASALILFYFDAMLFCRLAEAYGPHSLFDITRHPGTGRRTLSTLCLRNIVPAPFLQQRFTTAHSTTLFSATLSPAHYYRDLLGLPENSQWLEVESPFHADQLGVSIVRNLSTRYQHRSASLQPISELMGEQFAREPGNYLAFFSSYAYLEQVLERFQRSFPDIPIWSQSRSMNEGERSAFLARFSEHGRGVGFAVLGGAFGEGIDLPGRRLIGAFIATLGLPQINPVNEEMRERLEVMFSDSAGSGYEYAYLYPGLQKVVQAAGRVIRTTDDQGVVYLLDDRFGQRTVRDLLPRWWEISSRLM